MANSNFQKLAKLEQLQSLQLWLQHPVTEYLMGWLEEQARNGTSMVMSQAPANQAETTLREQVIGEVRGIQQLKVRVAVLINQLAEETDTKHEKPDNDAVSELES